MLDEAETTARSANWLLLEYARFDDLLAAIRGAGYRTVGPRLRDGAIVLDEVESSCDMPRGWLDEQEAGTYRLRRDERAGWFDFVVGPQSLKPFLLPPRETLYQLERTPSGTWDIHDREEKEPPLAVLGVRGCDLAALEILDRVLLGGEYRDPRYARRREALLLVGLSCRRAAPTCFCHSMGTGPELGSGCDVELREVDGGFLARGATPRGRKIVEPLRLEPAPSELVAESDRRLVQLQGDMASRSAHPSGPGNGRWINRGGLRDRLFARLTDRHWDEIAERCLACANCTMVCPTCFCTTVEETADLHQEHVIRERRWESCFTAEHSYTVAGTVHPTIASRYRQWMVHKLAAWEDQFGTTGCVGCGRCITWCPVGIDLTEEVHAFA